MSKLRLLAAATVAFATPVLAQTQAGAAPHTPAASTRVGPEHGTVIVVGGGSMPRDIYAAFIAAAGGPDALIVDIPTAGGAAAYGDQTPSSVGWKLAGARNVVVLHTTDRTLADTDSFPSVLARARGVWFEGGRQFHLVDSYAGTRTERAFHDVLARGGVVGGSSAGASILGDFLVRGAPSNNNMIMDDPSHEKGFAFLRGVGIDQHVVARSRLPDLADSIMPKYPNLLGMSEDEGTAWVVRGDTATIIGYDKAFAYGGHENDPGKPFLTLHPGDVYDLGARRVLSRALASLPLTEAFVDSVFSGVGTTHRATVLVARGGDVLIDKSYGVPDQPRFIPTTTEPQFPLGGMSDVFRALCSRLTVNTASADTTFQTCVARRLSPVIGMHRTRVESGEVWSDVDELYRLAVGLDENPMLVRAATGLATRDAFATPDGHRAAFVRDAADHETVIVLTDDDQADARGIATKLLERLGGMR